MGHFRRVFPHPDPVSNPSHIPHKAFVMFRLSSRSTTSYWDTRATCGMTTKASLSQSRSKMLSSRYHSRPRRRLQYLRRLKRLTWNKRLNLTLNHHNRARPQMELQFVRRPQCHPRCRIWAIRFRPRLKRSVKNPFNSSPTPISPNSRILKKKKNFSKRWPFAKPKPSLKPKNCLIHQKYWTTWYQVWSKSSTPCSSWIHHSPSTKTAILNSKSRK